MRERERGDKKRREEEKREGENAGKVPSVGFLSCLFDDSDSERYEVLFHCGFYVHLSYDY